MTRLVARAFDPAIASRLAAGGLPAALARALAARGVTRETQLQFTLERLLAPGGLAHDACGAVNSRAEEVVVATLIGPDVQPAAHREARATLGRRS